MWLKYLKDVPGEGLKNDIVWIEDDDLVMDAILNGKCGECVDSLGNLYNGMPSEIQEPHNEAYKKVKDKIKKEKDKTGKAKSDKYKAENPGADVGAGLD